ILTARLGGLSGVLPPRELRLVEGDGRPVLVVVHLVARPRRRLGDRGRGRRRQLSRAGAGAGDGRGGQAGPPSHWGDGGAGHAHVAAAVGVLLRLVTTAAAAGSAGAAAPGLLFVGHPVVFVAGSARPHPQGYEHPDEYDDRDQAEDNDQTPHSYHPTPWSSGRRRRGDLFP